MLLVLTDNTQYEIESISSADLSTLEASKQEEYNGISASNVFFKVGDEENIITKKEDIQTKLTDINLAGSYILRNNKKIHMNWSKLLNITVRISDSEYGIIAVIC